MSRVLITGGTGFIGKNLVSQLVADAKHEVCLLVREPYGMGTPLPQPLNQLREELNLFFADLRTASLVKRVLKEAKPDIVIHLAAVGSTDPFLSPQKAVRHNVDGMINLVEACFEKSYTTKKLIVARTPGELT
ncbi:MAG: NAD-dependent epimerase/dehydratase family protein, partial [Chloroflexota bacterium]